MTEDLKIERGIPLAPRKPKITHWNNIAKQMDIGDSVRLTSRGKAQALCNAINYLYRGSVNDEPAAAWRSVELGTYRVWRIK